MLLPSDLLETGMIFRAVKTEDCRAVRSKRAVYRFDDKGFGQAGSRQSFFEIARAAARAFADYRRRFQIHRQTVARNRVSAGTLEISVMLHI